MSIQSSRQMNHAISSSTLADVLERVLDKGLVIAGDIKIKLVDIELLTIQIRLVVASVDKAREMGMDWWTTNPDFRSRIEDSTAKAELDELRRRVQCLEGRSSGEPLTVESAPTVQVTH